MSLVWLINICMFLLIEVVCHILHYFLQAFLSLSITGFSDTNWDGSHSDRWCTYSYCSFIRSNLITWCSKNHNIIACSSVEVDYRAMAHSLILFQKCFEFIFS